MLPGPGERPEEFIPMLDLRRGSGEGYSRCRQFCVVCGGLVGLAGSAGTCGTAGGRRPSPGGGKKVKSDPRRLSGGKVWSVANAVLKASQIEKETLS